jgi:hypothetical protein
MYTCRICLDEENDNSKLIVPCLCKGSMKYIHPTCLDKLRKSNPNEYYNCKICEYKYKIRPTILAKYLRSKFIIALITLIVYMSFALIIGYIININFFVNNNYIIKYLLNGNIILGIFTSTSYFIRL